jgi:hypothetical protein
MIWIYWHFGYALALNYNQYSAIADFYRYTRTCRLLVKVSL